MNNTAIANLEPPSVLNSMAVHYGMDKAAFNATLRATVMPKDASNEQAAAFLLVAREHKLNPFTKEIFAFPARGGGIQPVVSVDGWMKLINSHPQFDGMSFTDHLDEKGALISVTCHMHRKDRSHPIEVTEYMSECKRDTDTWKKWPARMLRHKSAIQASRYAFGFAGIMEPDEAERADSVVMTQERVTPSSGVWESLSDERREHVETVGRTMQEYLDQDDIQGALDYRDRAGLEGAEEQTAIWTMFKSYERAAMKLADEDSVKALDYLIRNREKQQAKQNKTA